MNHLAVFYKGGTKTEVFISQFIAHGIWERCIGNVCMAASATAVKRNPVYLACLSRVSKSSIHAPTLQWLWQTLVWCLTEGCCWVWPSGSGCIVYRANDRLLLCCLDGVFMMMHEQFGCRLASVSYRALRIHWNNHSYIERSLLRLLSVKVAINSLNQ